MKMIFLTTSIKELVIYILVSFLISYLLWKIIDYLIVINCNIVSKDYLTDKNLKRMHRLYNIYKNSIDLVGNQYKVDGFYLEKNVFRFKNIGTNTSKEGSCFGFSYLIKHIFYGDISKIIKNGNDDIYNIKFIDKNLSRYRFDEETAVLVYENQKEECDLKKINDRNYDKANNLLKKGNIYLLTPEQIYKRVYSYNHIFTEYIITPQNRKIIEILKAIEYYQYKFDNDRKNFRIIISKYCTYKDRLDAVAIFYMSLLFKFDKKYKIKSVRTIKDLIINSINNNKLVIIGLGNVVIGGHAVLAYKYDKINEHTIKVYVYDCNIPLFSEGCSMNNSINQEIVKNTYILLKNINRNWHYIYSPTINKNFIYQGMFNSYVPNAQLCILDIDN